MKGLLVEGGIHQKVTSLLLCNITSSVEISYFGERGNVVKLVWHISPHLIVKIRILKPGYTLPSIECLHTGYQSWELNFWKNNMVAMNELDWNSHNMYSSRTLLRSSDKVLKVLTKRSFYWVSYNTNNNKNN